MKSSAGRGVGRSRARAAAAVVAGRSSLDLVVLAALAVIGLCLVVWQAAHVRGYTYGLWPGQAWSDYDEGVYLVSARELLAGQAIFSQIFSSQPPLFLAGLALSLRLAGGAAGAGHLYSLGCAVLALAGVAWLCWEIAGRWPALLAGLTLALSPGFEVAARAVEAEAPMLGLGSLAVAAATRYARLGGRRWLIAAGLLLAAATLSKLLAAALVLPVAVTLVLAAMQQAPGRPWPRLVADALLAALCVLAPTALAFILLAPGDQYDQVVRFHLRASAAIPASLGANLDQFGTYLSWDPGLLSLAIVGLAVATLSRLRLAVIPAAWLLGTVASMITYHPLFIHHLTVLAAPLAALAGLALGFVAFPAGALMRRSIRQVLAGGAALAYLIWLPVSLDHTGHAFVADADPTKAARVAWLKAHSGPGDLVLVDDQTLAVAANRLVPAPLVDTSIVRAKAGYLPLSLLIRESENPRVRAILLTRELRNGAHAAYRQWLRAHFQQVVVSTHDSALALVRAPSHSSTAGGS